MTMADPMLPKGKLHGKVAIVTGGASGIGAATARLFVAEGARMVVIADIQDELGQKAAASIDTQRCRYMHCDVTHEDQVQDLVNHTVRDHSRLDVMFSNAGTASTSVQTLLDLDLATLDNIFELNARGTAACVKHAARAMVEQRVKGSIVCTGSVAGSCGLHRRTDYSMSKHAVVGLVRSASLQLGQHGIRVNCVSPAGLATPLTCRLLEMEAEEVEKTYEKWSCLKGAVLKTQHVADAVLFLASDESQFVTGHDLVVDGGFLLSW